ncbi:unnamed protein product [Staurois parvus]|uniref:Uncharacterized protein n=1 Tax=Staurois parvus TaxID=386267 RepID=A0ABN9AZ99_9NEOB|nr:unnamed protein product [Staurois parvus]
MLMLSIVTVNHWIRKEFSPAGADWIILCWVFAFLWIIWAD